MNHADHIQALRAQIKQAVPRLANAKNQDEWWLLGTIGCHLCESAKNIITQWQCVQPISYQHIDIADFNEALMMQFATTIPVLLTPTMRLNYPFSVLDLQQILSVDTTNTLPKMETLPYLASNIEPLHQ